MNPEKRIFLTGIELAVEIAVVLVGEIGGLARPERLGRVDDIAVGFDGHWQESAVFLKQEVYAALFEELLVVIVDIEDDVGSALGARTFVHGIGGRAVAFPSHGLSALLIAQRVDDHLFGHHESRVEAESEMADYAVGRVLILRQEFFGARESNLVDIFVDIVGGHSDTVVADGQRSGLGVDLHCHLGVAYLTLEVAERRERAELLGSVHGIADELTQKNFVVAVEEFLYDGEYIFGRNPNRPLLCCHI